MGRKVEMACTQSFLLLGLILLLFSASCESGTTCHKKYQAQWEAGHSACLQPASSFNKGDVFKDEDRETIMNAHATIRRAVDPVAINMQMMVWDDEIAEIARAWASQCKYAHDTALARRVPGKYVVGQNMGFGYSRVEDLLAAWTSERTQFTYDGTNDPSKVKNYTQMIWAKTAKVGCAYAECDDMKKLYFCNYAPSMSVDTIKKPYNTGEEKCGDCPDVCDNGLCDCGGKVCENGAGIDLKRCSCSCMPQNVNPTDTCSLNCSVITVDMGMNCEAGSCDVIGTAQVCPHTCKDCPTAGVDFVDPDSGSMTQPLKTCTLLVMSLALLAMHF